MRRKKTESEMVIMGRPKRIRNLVGILKDKASLIKATLISTNSTTSYHHAILRATTHHPTEPPPLYTLQDVLSLGHHHRPTAFALVDTLLRRLHRTHSAHVALKCLLTLHHILSHGSPVLKDQITCDSLIDLSTFRDESDVDTRELSVWVRWYAKVLEQSLYLSPLTGQTRIITSLNSLVTMVEQICGAPESLHYQRISLIYEVMKLVGEDYRLTLREIFGRITEINEIIDELRDDDLIQLVGNLKRLEDCKEKLFLMFLNKKKNDGAWDFISRLRKDVDKVMEIRESLRLVKFPASGSYSGDGGSLPLAIVPAPRVKRWLDVAWNPLVVSRA